MSKLCSVAKQKKREIFVKKKWDKRQELKKIVINPEKSESERWEAKLALSKMPKNSSPTRLRNRCQFTGRARGFMRKFKLSRLSFREMANKGLLPGIVKASW